MPSAFLSHSTKNDYFVAELESFLHALDVTKVFNDSRSIPAGGEFAPAIEQGIRDCDVFVLVLSQDSVQSAYVKKEVEFAKSLGKRVVPVSIEACDVPEWVQEQDVVDWRPASRVRERKLAPSKITRHSPDRLFGRDNWLDALDAAWANPNLNVYTLVAWGGVGKTSLVAHWVSQRLAAKGWPGVERYFDWSFYSQGTGESRQTSADLIIQQALEFFGDPDPIKGGPWERGERLAGLIRQHRTLLVLDGIEPLQYPIGDPQAGRLKDQALEALLQSLAADNPGLCVVTTREHLKNIEGHATTKEEKLDKLLKEAAIALLRHLQLVGTEEEMAAAWKDAGGHALTLQLLGRFIADAYTDKHINHYQQVKFEEADAETQGRTAFKVMHAYERWLKTAGPERQRELAILRLTGLFDRPMSRGCLDALRAEPAIPGLTDELVKLKEPQWNIALKRLADIDLLTPSPEAVDAHPLIREYFGKQLRESQPEAFRAAHSRLFDHLCKTTEHRPDTIERLGPLYQAVVHGCLADRHDEARKNVYIDRILRGTGTGGFFSTFQLGAVGADLAAVAVFFERPWEQVTAHLSEEVQSWLLNEAAFRLRALGRQTESVAPMRAGLTMDLDQKQWKQAANSASNLSQLKASLGLLDEAVADARQSVEHADRSGDAGWRMASRTTLADALQQYGEREEAGRLFADAEERQKLLNPGHSILFSVQGSLYRNWLLAPDERLAWRTLAQRPATLLASEKSSTLANVEFRAATSLEWARLGSASLLSKALDHLTLAQVGLLSAITSGWRSGRRLDLTAVTEAVNGLRAAASMHNLPRGLLAAGLYHFLRGETDLAQARFAEAQQIAERGTMPLHLADVHLHRARLFRDKDELAKAAALIHKHKYGRRYDELADAEAASATW